MVDGSVVIKLHDLTTDTSDEGIREFFSLYGEVLEIRTGVWPEPYLCAGVPDGNRYVTAVLSKPVPSFVTIGVEETKVTYRGQQKTCRKCSLVVHQGISCAKSRKLLVKKMLLSEKAQDQEPAVPTSASIVQASGPSDPAKPVKVPQSKPTAQTVEPSASIAASTASMAALTMSD